MFFVIYYFYYRIGRDNDTCSNNKRGCN